MARELAPSWLAGTTAQNGLDSLPPRRAPDVADNTRLAALEHTGADWLILTANSPTSFPCPYRNEAVKVCRIVAQQHAK